MTDTWKCPYCKKCSQCLHHGMALCTCVFDFWNVCQNCVEEEVE